MPKLPPPLVVDPPIEIIRPLLDQAGAAPLVFSSPHSGSVYPTDFIAASRLDPLSLRRSEDAFVDELYAAAPACGAPLLKARFPRAFIDPNREPYELDPGMFADTLPAFVNRGSARVGAGLGTIARVVASGAEIYHGKLEFAEAEARIDAFYRPYHTALAGLLDAAAERFGGVLLIDCHSMPSVGSAADRDPGARRVDFVLGDCRGASCAPWVIDWAESFLRGLGYTVTRNEPFAGGFITRHYGQPRRGRHALQIELNRRLYMDENAIKPHAGFTRLARALTQFMQAAAEIASRKLCA